MMQFRWIIFLLVLSGLFSGAVFGQKSKVEQLLKKDLLDSTYSVFRNNPEIGISSDTAGISLFLQLGQSFEKKSTYNKSLQTYFLGLQRLDGQNKENELFVAKYFKRIGGNYFHLGNLGKAEDYWRNSFKIYKSNNLEKETSDALNNLAVLFYRNRQLDSAKNYYLEAIPMKQKLNLPRELCYLYLNLGSIYQAEQKIDSVVFYNQEALKIAESVNSAQLKGMCYDNIGKHYFAQEEYEKSKVFFRKAFVLSDSLPSVQLKIGVLNSLALVYDQMGNADSANIIRKEQIALQSDFLMQQSEKMTSQGEMEYFEKQLEQEIRILNIEKENSELSQQILWISVIGISLLAFAIYYSLNQRNKRIVQSKKNDELRIAQMQSEQRQLSLEKQNLEFDLENKKQEAKLQEEKIQSKNRELSMVTLHIIAKNDMLQEIRQFISISIPEDKTILKKIDGFISSDADWEQFKMQFENVHTDFFKILTERYPNITSDEIRLCAYLRMNLDSKEIAQILYISPDAVNKRRARLRKKLELTREVNLNQYLIQLS